MSISDTSVIDLSKLLTKEHEQKWVALTKDHKTVVAYDEDLLALDTRVGERDDIVFMKVPPSDGYLSF